MITYSDGEHRQNCSSCGMRPAVTTENGVPQCVPCARTDDATERAYRDTDQAPPWWGSDEYDGEPDEEEAEAE